MIHIETLAERNDRYIREGRAVSGAKDGNGPGKPGYKFLQLTGDAATDETAINALADEGYRVEAQMGANDMYLLLENYDMKGK